MARLNRTQIIEKLNAAGIAYDVESTNAALLELLPAETDSEDEDAGTTPPPPPAESDDGTVSETPKERAARKATEAGPIVKRKKKLIKPQVRDLYGWAVNRSKAQRAHTEVLLNPHANPAFVGLVENTPKFEQAVMDVYVMHGGLVRGQEAASTVGRRRPIRPMSAPGAGDGETTNELVAKAQGQNMDLEDDE